MSLLSRTSHCGAASITRLLLLLLLLCRMVLDDFREAYYWLRHNTAPDARIMSWWVWCRGWRLGATAMRLRAACKHCHCMQCIFVAHRSIQSPRYGAALQAYDVRQLMRLLGKSKHSLYGSVDTTSALTLRCCLLCMCGLQVGLRLPDHK